MSTRVAFYPRPPSNPLLDAIDRFVRRHDPRTAAGALLYAGIGLAIGFVLGSL